jgi:hypothetical protein
MNKKAIPQKLMVKGDVDMNKIIKSLDSDIIPEYIPPQLNPNNQRNTDIYQRNEESRISIPPLISDNNEFNSKGDGVLGSGRLSLPPNRPTYPRMEAKNTVMHPLVDPGFALSPNEIRKQRLLMYQIQAIARRKK